MFVFVVVTGICSILGFIIGVVTTEMGRDAATVIRRSLRVPGLGPRIINQGIYDFFGSRNSLSRRRSPEMFDYVRHAKNEIGIIAISLQRSIVHQKMHQKLEELLRQNQDLVVYLFLLDPKSPIVSRVAKATDRSESELRTAIDASVERIKLSKDRLGSSGDRLHLSLYDGYIANSLIAIDPSAPDSWRRRSGARFLVEHYLFGLAIDERYSFEVRRQRSQMFTKVSNVYHDFKELYT